MPIGDPGKEQFRNAQVKMRNVALAGYIGQLFLFREEFLANDEMAVRTGFDTPTLVHLNSHLNNVDRWRRRITHNPENVDLKVLVENARDTSKTIAQAQTSKAPGGDDIQRSPGAMFDLPFALDGSDPNIPLMSALELRNPLALSVYIAIDRHIVEATRCEDRLSTHRITPFTSLMFFGALQEVYTIINDFGGDTNRLHIAAGTRRTEEPRGPLAAPNAKQELSSGDSSGG